MAPRSTTLLDALSRPNPVIEPGTPEDHNSASPHWPVIDSWYPWHDFNARNLYDMFHRVCDTGWVPDAADAATPAGWDRRVFDEDSLDHYLSRFMMPTVNAALRHACRKLGTREGAIPHIGRGGRCYYEETPDGRLRPDWSMCSADLKVNDRLYRNLMPGGTKLSGQWASGMYETHRHHMWRDPVRQMLHYTSQLNVRYGWLCTDAELVVFRASFQPARDAIPSARPARQQEQQPAPTTHERVASGSTHLSQMSSQLQGMSLGESSSSYPPAEPPVEDYRVEYQSVPWRNYGSGKTRLSIRSALFYLAMMAVFGERSMRRAYPALDSWWYRDDGTFSHNTTGVVSKTSPQTLQHPDPAGKRRPGFVTITFQDGESVEYPTRASVRALNVDPQRQQYYYDETHQDEQGNGVRRRVFITERTVAYDEVTGRYGRFRRLAWVEGTAEKEGEEEEGQAGKDGASGSKRSSRHHKESGGRSNKPSRKHRK